MDATPILDVTAATFDRDVLEASRATPVLVDFWAPWCGPCRTLGPMLEAIASEYGGRFRLAKVNSDENAALAQRYNVRSIPDVRAFRHGAEVDRFIGVLPERELRSFIDRIAPPPAEVERLAAAGLRADGDLAGAIEALRRAVAMDPDHHPARIDLAEALLEAGAPSEASAELDRVRRNVDWDERVGALRHAIAFAAAGGDEAQLARRVAANPADLEARLALAAALAARKAWSRAMEELLEIIRADKSWRDGEARKQMLAIFNLANDPALVSEYRRKLATALH